QGSSREFAAGPPALRESALAHERAGLGRTSAEARVSRLRVPEIAGGIDVPEQLRREIGVEDVAALLEGLEAVGVERLRPEIAVVARRVSAAAEDVLEMRRAVPHGDRLRHPEPLELLLLESDDVGVPAIRSPVQSEVHQCGCAVLDRRKTLVELLRRNQLAEH